MFPTAIGKMASHTVNASIGCTFLWKRLQQGRWDNFVLRKVPSEQTDGSHKFRKVDGPEEAILQKSLALLARM